MRHFFRAINMIYFLDEPLSNGSRVLPISICVCGSASEAASVWYVTMLPGHLLYTQTQASELHSVISKRSRMGRCNHVLLSPFVKRHALQTHHGYAIVFIINSINTIWRPLRPICKHMATLRWGGDTVYLKSWRSRRRSRFLKWSLSGMSRNNVETFASPQAWISW